MPRKFEISEELAQATADYLSTQPYREVHALMAGFQRLNEVGCQCDQESEEKGPR